jgi:hypothetical protein
VLESGADAARAALAEVGADGVGEHLGVTAEDDVSATHHFACTMHGYRGWQWAVVVAAAPGTTSATVSESALLPGPDAIIAPEWLPWDQRVQPGDLGPGDVLAPPANDPRLVPGFAGTGDPEIDDIAYEAGLGRRQVLSQFGRIDAAQRWFEGDFGPNSEMAKSAPSICGLCGFFAPLAGALHQEFGVCCNELSADAHVVHFSYGCGAHSDTVAPAGQGSPAFEPFDDAAVEVVVIEPRRPSEAPAETSAEAPAESPAESPSEAPTGSAAEESQSAPAEPLAVE